MGKTQFDQDTLAVADPGFLSLGRKPTLWQDVTENCMKLKGIGPRGGYAFLVPHPTRFGLVNEENFYLQCT